MVGLTTVDVIAQASFVYLAYQYVTRPSRKPIATTVESAKPSQPSARSIMSAPRNDLAPPRYDPFTQEQLKMYNGSNPEQPVYVAIKGTIFDVTRRADTYGPGGSYNILAGKDASRCLARSTLKPEDVGAECGDLSEKQRKVLDEWYVFFRKRYNIVGTLVDPPAMLSLL